MSDRKYLTQVFSSCLDFTLYRYLQNLVVTGRKKLKKYFENRVTHGPGAFSMLAIGYRDYERAMTKRLLIALSPPAISDGGFMQKVKNTLFKSPRLRLIL